MKRMRRDERGAAAILFAVALVLLVPLVIGVFEIYYGSEQRGKLQDSLDAAALFAARSTANTDDQLTTIGRTALDANLTLEPGAVLNSATFKLNGDIVVADAQLQPASLLSSGSTLWKYPVMHVHTEVNRSLDRLEIALVLDNTGSMAGTKLSTLKTAAKNLVDTLVNATANSTLTDPVKISLVPFSNTVRVQGTTSLATYDPAKSSNAGIPSWIDPKGRSHQVNGANMDIFNQPNFDRLAAMRNMTQGTTQIAWEGCVEARPEPYDVQDTAPSAGDPKSLYVPYFWPDEPDYGSVFYPNGSGSYYSVRGNDYIYDTPAWSSTASYGEGDIVSYTPPTWKSTTTYTSGELVTYSGQVYQAKNISGNRNKKPSTSGSYWASFSGTSFWKATAANTGSEPGPTSDWTNDSNRDPKTRELNSPKYGEAASSVALKRSGNTSMGTGYPFGPNAGCYLTPMMRLTTNMTALKSAIDTMTAVGETHIPIGLAWGWNTLSPNAPFSDGQAYGALHNRKIAIVMTDGENTMSNPSGSYEPNGSIYGGYGYIWQALLGLDSNTWNSARTSAIDDRLATLCTNMKAKGIILYTVRVEVTTGSSSLLQNCASSPDKFYDVQNVADLNAAFQAIARSIDNLRISK